MAPNKKHIKSSKINVGGRPMHDDWFGYEKTYVNGKVAANCCNCLKTFGNTAQIRLAKHREICGTRNIVKSESKSDVPNFDYIEITNNIEIEDIKTESAGSDLLLTESPKSPLNLNVDYSGDLQEQSSFVSERKDIRCQTPEGKAFVRREHLDLMLAEFFYGCNVPFSVSDSIYFRKLVKALCPAYIQPQSHLLSGHLLDKVHEKIEKRNSKMIAKMDNQMILLINGWQNFSSNRHNVVMMLTSSNNEKVFLESFDFPSIHEAVSSKQIISATKQAITLAKERYDAEVYAILSDIESITVAGEESLNLLSSTCNVRSAISLADDILKTSENSKLMTKVMNLQNEWANQSNAIVYFVKKLSALKKIATANDSERLFDNDFLASVTKLIKLLNPVAELIDYCQKSGSTAADAAEKWLQLCVDGPEQLREFSKHRCKQNNVFNIVTLTANYFHPVYRGKHLNQEQQKQVKNYIFEELEAAELESCHMFMENIGVFATLKRKNLTNPKTFWHFAAEQGHKELATFAMKFSKIPASIPQLEWHTNINEELSVEVSKKLMNVYFTLQSADEKLDDDVNSAAILCAEDVFKGSIESRIANKTEQSPIKSNFKKIKENLVEQYVNKPDASYECHKCKVPLDSIYRLHQHVKRHRNATPHKCEICGMHYSEENFKQHLCRRKVIQCEYCSESFENTLNLLDHLNNHKNQRSLSMYKCNSCRKRYPMKLLVDWHMNQHNAMEKPHICDVCNRRYRTVELLTKHKDLHSNARPHLCSDCGKGFKTINTLRSHIVRHSAVKSIFCTKCPKKFYDKGQLNKHMDVHSNVRYVCVLCNASLGSKASLNEHKRRIHRKANEQTCDLCFMKFRTPHNLRRHLLTHTGERPYKCQYCSRTFAQNGDLSKHLRSHIGQNIYSCEICSKTFRLQIELRKHSYEHFQNQSNNENSIKMED